MADIIANANFQVNKGSLVFQKNANIQTDPLVAAHYSAGVQNIPTTAAGTALTFSSSVSTAGWAWFINLDSTNYVEIGGQTGGTTFIPIVRIKPGGFAFFRAATTTLYARANTAAVDLEHVLLND
jgi:hypothetical protein